MPSKTKPKAKPKTAAKTKTALATVEDKSPIVVISSSEAGRYSNDLPPDLLSRYSSSMTDPETITLTSELALVDARIAALMRRLKAEADKDGAEIGGAGDWVAAHNAFKLLRRGLLVRDKEQQHEAMLRLDTLFTRVADSKETWNEAMELVERRRKLVESEARAQMRMVQYFKSKDVRTFVAAVSSAVRAEVEDDAAIQRIIKRVQELCAELQPGS